MTSNRAKAYGRVMRTLDDLGPSKLLPQELELIRASADVLFFCEDVTSDGAARRALADCRDLVNRLVESERWLEETARRLVSDLEGCGSLLPVAG
jgi:hypothetical protein